MPSGCCFLLLLLHHHLFFLLLRSPPSPPLLSRCQKISAVSTLGPFRKPLLQTLTPTVQAAASQALSHAKCIGRGWRLQESQGSISALTRHSVLFLNGTSLSPLHSAVLGHRPAGASHSTQCLGHRQSEGER